MPLSLRRVFWIWRVFAGPRRSTLCRPRPRSDTANRQLSLTGDRTPQSYDWLSLNLGAEDRAPKRPGCLPIKPLEPVLAALASLPAGAAVRMVGSGPAAVEVSLALAARGFAVSLSAKPERAFWQGLRRPESSRSAAGCGAQSCDVSWSCTARVVGGLAGSPKAAWPGRPRAVLTGLICVR